MTTADIQKEVDEYIISNGKTPSIIVIHPQALKEAVEGYIRPDYFKEVLEKDQTFGLRFKEILMVRSKDLPENGILLF